MMGSPSWGTSRSELKWSGATVGGGGGVVVVEVVCDVVELVLAGVEVDFDVVDFDEQPANATAPAVMIAATRMTPATLPAAGTG
jgi:hypothetical protein